MDRQWQTDEKEGKLNCCAVKEEKIGPTVPPKLRSKNHRSARRLHLPVTSEYAARLRDLRGACCGQALPRPGHLSVGLPAADGASFTWRDRPATTYFRFLQPPAPHAQVSPAVFFGEGKSSPNGKLNSYDAVDGRKRREMGLCIFYPTLGNTSTSS